MVIAYKFMKKEDKELLIKDLCARLPYGVYVNYKNVENKEGIIMLNPYNIQHIYSGWWKKYKPYLRPMSSMTEEEKVQLSQYACIGEDLNGEFIDEVQRKDCVAYIDWLNKNHFDYRGLIKKGLALEAPEGMYNIKEQ